MMKLKLFLILWLLPFTVFSHELELDPLKEYRYCTIEPKRDADGNIYRRSDVLTAYKKLYPCPSTMKTTGACPGWAIDHSIPLACGGCDAVFNLVWLPNDIKSCSDDACKDRWERKLFCKQSKVSVEWHGEAFYPWTIEGGDNWIEPGELREFAQGETIEGDPWLPPLLPPAR